MILGRDILLRLGLVLDLKQKICTWEEVTINKRKLTNNPSATHLLFDVLEDDLENDHDSIHLHTFNDETFTASDTLTNNEPATDNNNGYKSKIIKSSTYEAADLKKLTQHCTHPSLNQQNDLYDIPSK